MVCYDMLSLRPTPEGVGFRSLRSTLFTARSEPLFMDAPGEASDDADDGLTTYIPGATLTGRYDP